MKRISKLINFPEQLVEEVNKYQEENGIATFTAATLELVRKGLNKQVGTANEKRLPYGQSFHSLKNTAKEEELMKKYKFNGYLETEFTISAQDKKSAIQTAEDFMQGRIEETEECLDMDFDGYADFKGEVKETVNLGKLVNDLKKELENGEVKRSVAFLDLVLSNGDVWTMLEDQLEEEGY